MSGILFDRDFMRKIEYLATVARRLYRLRARPRRRKKVGAGLEFADRRGYESGDDFRYIDWDSYARLERLLVRLFEEEQEMCVYCLLDCSGSMALGSPAKFDQARRTLAALAYLALSNAGRVSVWPFASGLKAFLSPVKGKAQIFSITGFLDGLRAGGVTDFASSCLSFVSRVHKPGLAIVISDFFDVPGWEMGLKTLFHNKFDLFLIHIYEERDRAPDFLSDVRLTDSETRQALFLTVNSRLRDAYLREFALFQKEMSAFAGRHGAGWLSALASVPFEETVLQALRLGEFAG